MTGQLRVSSSRLAAFASQLLSSLFQLSFAMMSATTDTSATAVTSIEVHNQHQSFFCSKHSIDINPRGRPDEMPALQGRAEIGLQSFRIVLPFIPPPFCHDELNNRYYSESNAHASKCCQRKYTFTDGNPPQNQS